MNLTELYLIFYVLNQICIIYATNDTIEFKNVYISTI